MPALRPAPSTRDLAQIGMDPLLAATITKLPAGGPWPAPEREAFFTLLRNVCDVVYGPVERNMPLGIPGETFGQAVARAEREATAPKLYVIKENGAARCDGQPMAFADIPITGCAFIDKRGPTDDRVFAWESIMFSDGTVKAGTAMPAGVTLVPKVAGPKVRAVAGGDDDYQGAIVD
jgi:hypothetical protein